MALQVDIVTPEQLVYSGPASEVLVPGWEGQFCALEEHALSLVLLRGGVVQIAGDSWVVGRGFAEITGNQLTLLVDHCEPAGTVDQATAQQDYSAAEAKLALSADGSGDWSAAEEEMEKAVARLSS
jgi:F-type H+-transporting ATPase subunit epsilon